MSDSAAHQDESRPSAPVTFELTRDMNFDLTALVRAAHAPALRVVPDDAVTAALEASVVTLREIVVREEPLYGWNTGFGPHVRSSVDPEDPRHAVGLLEHLGAGYGPDTDIQVVRLSMLLRLITISRGHSGVRGSVFAAYAKLLEHPGAPVVPVGGSLGASGDLVPLAHIARILIGRGDWSHAGRTIPGAELLKRVGLEARVLNAREALALTNGTSASTAWALLALERGQRLIQCCEALTGLIMRSLGASPEALDDDLHAAREHPDQRASAAAIQAALGQGDSSPGERERLRGTTPPLQEPYSLRAAPQILGACRGQLRTASESLGAEVAGVDDNPLLFPATHDRPARAVHGANFFGQQVAFAADAINVALTQAGILVERQLALLLDPARNGGAPLLLASAPGRSGLAGLQLTATALVAEMRSAASPAAVGSIPTNGDNQDIVPMAHEAGRKAVAQTSRLAGVMSTLTIAMAQLHHLRRSGRAPGTAIEFPEWFPMLGGVDEDRALRDEIDQVARTYLNHARG